MFMASSTRTLFTGTPSGPVWYVTRLDFKRLLAKDSASPGDFTSFTPPALPLPPAWTCALTTTGSPISKVAVAA